ncbi:MAG: hypothetical protein ABIQ65_14145 [Thermoanaerobaculia bacterium]
MKGFLNREETADAIVAMDGEDLSITLVGVTIFMAASGVWTGEVRVPAPIFFVSANEPPPENPILIEVRGDRLFVGPFSMNCVKQDAWRSEIPLTLDTPLADVLRVRLTHSKERIVLAGLERRIEAAETDVAFRFAEAMVHLSDLEITEVDLWRLLDECLARKIPPPA